MGVQLLSEVGAVYLDGFNGDNQVLGDLLIAVSLGDQLRLATRAFADTGMWNLPTLTATGGAAMRIDKLPKRFHAPRIPRRP